MKITAKTYKAYLHHTISHLVSQAMSWVQEANRLHKDETVDAAEKEKRTQDLSDRVLHVMIALSPYFNYAKKEIPTAAPFIAFMETEYKRVIADGKLQPCPCYCCMPIAMNEGKR